VSLARVGATCTRLYQLSQAGLEKTRLKKKPSPLVFLGFFFLFFLVFFSIFAQKREFFGSFQSQEHF
jgi:hypothetical protein